jgi:hypothetical protein
MCRTKGIEMSNKNRDQSEQENSTETLGASGQNSNPVASPSRRRLIKLGSAAVPVIATLASRPALAWHCKSPSAWGSEIINPNTSLKTNAGHQSYPDETWYISNWRDNVARSSAGYNGKPWDVLRSKYSAINNLPANSPLKTSLDYTKVTIAQLQVAVPGIRMAGASPSALVKSVLSSGTDLQKSTIVAQLNYLLLSPLSRNQIEMCLPASALQQMADGTYKPAGLSQPWSAAHVKRYLYENWIAR